MKHNAFLAYAKDAPDAKEFVAKLESEHKARILYFNYEQLKIDDARFLSEKFYQSSSERFVFSVFFAKMLTPAQNALLKVLEDLPKANIVYFMTPAPNALLDTLKSRMILLDNARETKESSIIKNFKSMSLQERLKFLDTIHKDVQKELDFLAELEDAVSAALKSETLKAQDAKRVMLYKKALAQNLQPTKALRDSLAFLEL